MGLSYPAEYILTEAKLAHGRAEEDQDALAILGVSTEWLDAFGQEIEAAESLPDIVGQRVELTALTNEKDDVLEECYTWADNLQERIRFLFGTNSSLYQRFPTDQLDEARRSERKLMPLMDALIQIAEELGEDHMPAEEMDAGRELQAELRAADEVQEKQKVDSLSVTEERTQVFQTLYDKVNRINRAGRIVFKNDPVKAARYRSPWYQYRARQRQTAPEEVNQEVAAE